MCVCYIRLKNSSNNRGKDLQFENKEIKFEENIYVTIVKVNHNLNSGFIEYTKLYTSFRL